MAVLGKKVGDKRYVHAEQVPSLPEDLRTAVNSAAEMLTRQGLQSYNVVRVDNEFQQFAFLNYPTLGEVPFPALESSWRYDAQTLGVTYRNYADSLNPPILHRTELLLPPGHPSKDACSSLTEDCERIGLFDNPTIIGFQRSWNDLIQSRGYEVQGFELRPLGNVNQDELETGQLTDSNEPTSILRHLTALSRSTLSAPVQSLIRDGLLTVESSFFDYGCGKGDDLAALTASGFNGSGWDPYYRPEGDRTPADVVNIGFVINVIEDLEERMDALTNAFALARSVLAVAAILSFNSNQPAHARPYKDGVRTGRNTFQKHFTQTELQQFIEGVLDEDAYPAGPGVFYVFRDHAVEQRYLVSRTSDRSRINRARLATINYARAPKVERPKVERLAPPKKSETPEAIAYLERLWATCLEFGRLPDIEEMPDPDEARQLFGSPKRAVGACLARNDESILQRAEAGRCDDILVMLALHFFERRRRFAQLEPRLQRDVRALFGSYQTAEAKAHQLLFSVKDPKIIGGACEQAAANGLGWLDPGHSLQLHTSLVERLPAPLRIYIGCATALAGDLKAYDLVKVHIESGKVTLMSFDDFAEKPLPTLQSRVKVRLRDQDFDIFAYTGSYLPTVLYHKSRYINEEFPHYAEQLAFDESFEKLALFDLSGHGLPEDAVLRTLNAARYELGPFGLQRSMTIPHLDDPCGSHFKYRDLVECGETWETTKVDNAPRSPDSYTALCDLARYILDPVIDYFGAIKLTYGFARTSLTKHIRGRIAPSLDQHASYELTSTGRAVCSRSGAAVDFLVEYEDMRGVAEWVAANTPFDRLYFYGSDRPIHVSYGPEHNREVVDMLTTASGRRVPRKRAHCAKAL
jgi:DNA phosphorothioation-associated putative methyltransferase